MAILIVGGAGYIGSHTVKYFLDAKQEVVAFDNLQTGHKASVDKRAKFYVGDLRHKESIEKVFAENKIDGVIHFAANSLVGESMENPIMYFDNNVAGFINLLYVMEKYACKKIVFSSTAAVYGEPKIIPISEDDEKNPQNPYGQSKLMMEQIMKWMDISKGIKFVSLRYFNAAGAIESGEIGEDHKRESHLIPLILQVPLKKRKSISIFGNDYDTPDGTCLRDYIHVMDLAEAHYLALKYLEKENKSDVFNLGTGDGYSVLEIINTAKEVTKEDIPYVIEKRRAGDPARLIAKSEKSKNILKWEPKHSSIKNIIKTAWNYHKNNPNGFKD